MPVCKLCSTTFPLVIVIKGKKRNLKNRRRCLVCSPFVEEGRRLPAAPEDKVCVTCGRVYPYSRKNRRGHTTTHCNSCMCNLNRNGRKEQAVAYLGGKCKVCGYNRCIQALSFHHTTDDKDFTISGRYGCSWKTLKVELDKCVLLCQNCHQEAHYGLLELKVP